MIIASEFFEGLVAALVDRTHERRFAPPGAPASAAGARPPAAQRAQIGSLVRALEAVDLRGIERVRMRDRASYRRARQRNGAAVAAACMDAVADARKRGPS